VQALAVLGTSQRSTPKRRPDAPVEEDSVNHATIG
jgi:hypothetical protein